LAITRQVNKDTLKRNVYFENYERKNIVRAKVVGLGNPGYHETG